MYGISGKGGFVCCCDWFVKVGEGNSRSILYRHVSFVLIVGVE